MPPIASHPIPYRRLTVPVVLLAVAAVAGCGAPPELRQPGPRPASTSTASASPTPVAPPTGLPGVPPPTTTAPEPVAVACRDRPSGGKVLALLRGPADVLPRDVAVRVRTGPLCAGGWQYTVLAVTGREELQVITRGPADDLELVTAGTDVCTIEVRAAGPAGIRTLACDGGPAGVPGA